LPWILFNPTASMPSCPRRWRRSSFRRCAPHSPTVVSVSDIASGLSHPAVRAARAVGVEAEIDLPFAALHQLCAPLLDRLFRVMNVEEKARSVISRYAGRNRVEDGLGTAVNFFHLDCLASEVRLNVDLDTVMTVLANGCYRWLGRQLRGFEKAAPKQLYRRFVETAGTVVTEANRIVVQFDRRCHNPILREAALDREAAPIPWLGNRRIRFAFD